MSQGCMSERCAHFQILEGRGDSVWLWQGPPVLGDACPVKGRGVCSLISKVSANKGEAEMPRMRPGVNGREPGEAVKGAFMGLSASLSPSKICKII